MSTCDVIICVDQATLGGIVAALYGRPSLRDKLFRGSRAVDVLGVNVNVTFDVLQPPVISLNSPTDEQWRLGITKDGNPAQKAPNAVVVHFGQVKVGKQREAGGYDETTTAFDAICTIGLANNTLAIDPLAVIVDLSHASPDDQIIFPAVVIPQILQMVGTMLSGEHLPDINFQGIRFGDVVLSVGGGRLAAVANLAGKPAPGAPLLDSLPPGQFYLLLSPAVMQSFADSAAAGMNGKQLPPQSGSQGFGVASAEWNANARLDHVSARVSPADMTSLDLAVTVSIDASAGVNILGPLGDLVNKAGNAIVDAGKTVGDGIVDTANKIADAFSSY
ncbi:MAG TPA: hypothetical protein VGK74_03710 [Symbiobacteriaceae bacterium]|jgi:hypothetical protein